MSIPFTQYMMPNGRKVEVFVDRPSKIEKKAHLVIEAGYVFEVEMLSDMKTVSLTVSNGEEDVAIELASNGPEVLVAVDRLVEAAHRLLEEAA